MTEAYPSARRLWRWHLSNKTLILDLITGGGNMCVGLKVKVADIENGMAVVDASGVKRTISAELIEDLAPGDYVMVHAGIAIAKIDGDENTEADEVMEAVNGN